jgi:hypothetical protein
MTSSGLYVHGRKLVTCFGAMGIAPGRLKVPGTVPLKAIRIAFYKLKETGEELVCFRFTSVRRCVY